MNRPCIRIVLISSDWHGWMALQGLLQLSECVVTGIVTVPSDQARSTVGYVNFTQLCPLFHVLTITGVNTPEAYHFITEHQPDVLLVVGWSELLGAELLSLPNCIKIGFHPTALPKHRGRAPIPWTIIHDVRRSAVSFFQLQSGADTGPVILQRPFEITDSDTAGTIFRTVGRVIRTGMRDLILALKHPEDYPPQDSRQGSVWTRRRPADGIIDWNCSAMALYNWIRGLSFPYPGAFTYRGHSRLIIWRSDIAPATRPLAPGTVRVSMTGDVYVDTGSGALRLQVVQEEGGRPERARAWAIRTGIASGEVLG